MELVMEEPAESFAGSYCYEMQMDLPAAHILVPIFRWGTRFLPPMDREFYLKEQGLFNLDFMPESQRDLREAKEEPPRVGRS